MKKKAGRYGFMMAVILFLPPRPRCPISERHSLFLWNGEGGRGPLRELPSESLFLTCPNKLWVHAEVWMNIP